MIPISIAFILGLCMGIFAMCLCKAGAVSSRYNEELERKLH